MRCWAEIRSVVTLSRRAWRPLAQMFVADVALILCLYIVLNYVGTLMLGFSSGVSTMIISLVVYFVLAVAIYSLFKLFVMNQLRSALALRPIRWDLYWRFALTNFLLLVLFYAGNTIVSFIGYSVRENLAVVAFYGLYVPFLLVFFVYTNLVHALFGQKGLRDAFALGWKNVRKILGLLVVVIVTAGGGGFLLGLAFSLAVSALGIQATTILQYVANGLFFILGYLIVLVWARLWIFSLAKSTR